MNREVVVELFVQVMFWLYLVVVLSRGFVISRSKTASLKNEYIGLIIDIGIVLWAYSLLINN